jgi:hypothetical protein
MEAGQGQGGGINARGIICKQATARQAATKARMVEGKTGGVRGIIVRGMKPRPRFGIHLTIIPLTNLPENERF